MKFDNSAFYDLISQEVHHVIVAHVVVAFFRLRIGFRFRTGLMSCFSRLMCEVCVGVRASVSTSWKFHGYAPAGVLAAFWRVRLCEGTGNGPLRRTRYWSWSPARLCAGFRAGASAGSV